MSHAVEKPETTVTTQGAFLEYFLVEVILDEISANVLETKEMSKTAMADRISPAASFGLSIAGRIIKIAIFVLSGGTILVLYIFLRRSFVENKYWRGYLKCFADVEELRSAEKKKRKREKKQRKLSQLADRENQSGAASAASRSQRYQSQFGSGANTPSTPANVPPASGSGNAAGNMKAESRAIADQLRSKLDALPSATNEDEARRRGEQLLLIHAIESSNRNKDVPLEEFRNLVQAAATYVNANVGANGKAFEDAVAAMEALIQATERKLKEKGATLAVQ